MSDINDLKQKRNTLIQEGRDIYDAADTENRSLTDEESANDDARFDQISDLTAQLDRREKQLKVEALVEKIPDSVTLPDTDQRSEQPELTTEERAMEQLPGYLRRGERVFASGQAEELRALSAGLDTEGGYTVPKQFNATLIQAVDDMVFIRQRATKFTLGVGESLGFPSLDNDPADSDWTAELATGGEDSTMSFGDRELRPHPLAKRLKVSNKLIRSSVINITSLVRERLAYKFAVTEEKGLLTGSGGGEPLGIFTASASGISTARDVATGNTTSSITFDGLIEAQYSLKGNYWNRSDWLFHRDALKQIRKLKDGDGQYIWQPGGQVGQPDSLLGRPFMMSEFVPNTFTSGLYVGMLADYSFVWIVDALGLSIQVLTELYAEANQIGYIGRLEADGMPVLEEAFARITLG